MAMMPIQLKPGINSLASRLTVGSGWWASNLIRWKDGLLQKLGGWLGICTKPLIGICRGMCAFSDLLGNKYLACGTTSNLEILYNNQLYDITPVRKISSSLSAPFSVVAGSGIITVTDNLSGVLLGDSVYVPSSVAIGGEIIQGWYVVQSVISGSQYTIVSNNNFLSTVTLGGVLPVYTTTASSTTVTCSLTNHGLQVGSDFLVGASTAVGGITLSGAYQVASVINSNSFTFLVGSLATSGATATENGGDVTIQYSIHSESPGTIRNWFLDNWGNSLMGCPTNGPLYVWTPPLSNGNVASVISQAPSANAGFFIAMPEQIAVCLGCTDPTTGEQDPLLVRWSDVGDYTVWTASATNQAGSYRLSRGSVIVGGLQAPLQAFIWTDTDLWVMFYQGFPLVFGFQQVGWACGLIGPKAAARLGAQVFWMGAKTFFCYDGSGVRPIPCPVWDFVFENLDTTNASEIVAAPNNEFSEISWYFPVNTGGALRSGSFGYGNFGDGPFGGSSIPIANNVSAYVKYNTKDNLWDYGYLSRSSWVDQSVLGNPIGVDENGYIQQHEISDDANGTSMPSAAQSGWIDVSNGGDIMFIERLLPDNVLQGSGSLNITVQAVNYAGDTPRTYGPYTVDSSTRYVTVRARGRFIALDIDMSQLGSFTRLGQFLALVAPSGKR